MLKRWIRFRLARLLIRLAGEPPAERQVPTLCHRLHHDDGEVTRGAET